MITEHAPYAPTDGVITVLNRYRDTGLGGQKITTDLIKRLAIGATVADRVVDTLRVLDLIDDEGTPTDAFVAFKQAHEDSYRDVFKGVLLDAYSPVFAVTGQDLSEKRPADIEHAFRSYRPESLRKRMVTLFLGLCQYAGLIDQAPVRPRGPRPGASATPKKSSVGATSKRASRQTRNGDQNRGPEGPGVIFGVSEEDIAALSEDEFDTVWSALGTVARARARASQAPTSPRAEEGVDEN